MMVPLYPNTETHTPSLYVHMATLKLLWGHYGTQPILQLGTYMYAFLTPTHASTHTNTVCMVAYMHVWQHHFIKINIFFEMNLI